MTASTEALDTSNVGAGSRWLPLAGVVLGLALLMGAAGIAFSILDNQSPGGEGWSVDWFASELTIWIVFVAFLIVSYLLVTRRPDHAISWLLLGITAATAVDRLLDPYSTYAVHGGIGGYGLGTLAASVDEAGWVLPVALSTTFLILLFPDGHLPSPRWRWFARILGVGIGLLFLLTLFNPDVLQNSGVSTLSIAGQRPGLENRLGLSWLWPVQPVWVTLLFLLPMFMVGSAIALVLRFRGSSGVERLQLRWLVSAAGLVAALAAVALPLGLAFTWTGPRPGWVQLIEALTILSFALIPISIGVAILKYRLYDIDVVINKALVYGCLAAFITAVYVAIVVGIGSAIGRSAGRPSLPLSILATAVVAVAFGPVKARVQRLANRLVYGKRAAPYEVLSDLSKRMAGAFATDELLPRVARLLADGTGAQRAEIWLRVGSDLLRNAAWPPEEDPETGPGSLPCPTEILPDVPEASRVVAVRDDDELLGALVVVKGRGDPLTPPEDKLADDLGKQASLILRNVRLVEELRASQQRIVAAQDEERRRLERDIHDGAQQQLVTLSLATRLAQTTAGPEAPSRLQEILDRATEELKEAMAELRELARGIHPRILTERGLGAAIRFLAERSPVPVTVSADGNGRLPDPIEATAYFAVSEALTNVAKYARASTVTVGAERANGSLVVRVADDGVGGADPSKGTGLRGLFDRVAAVGGELRIDSPPGRGTRLTIELPVGTGH